MAHYHDYNNPDNRRINYSELEQSSIGSKWILAILALIGLAIVLMFTFGDVSTTGDSLPGLTQTNPPAATQPAPAQ